MADKDTTAELKKRVDQLDEMFVANTILSRAQMARQFLDPRRNLDDECGLPTTSTITIDDYKQLYDRVAIAKRSVGLLPDESWMVQPTVYETEDVDEETPFEKAWRDLSITPQKSSWYRTEKGHPIWERLRRGDELSGIGRYGILLLGIDDGKPLVEPVEGIGEDGQATGSNTPQRKLLYVRAFDESQCPVSAWEKDVANPRYGQPIQYSVSFADPSGTGTREGALVNKQEVHWTRVVHLADNRGSSEVFGVPRLLPIYDNILGLRKLYCASPEMYYRGAFPGFSLETHPSLGGDVNIDKEALQGQMEAYTNSLQRYFVTKGLQAKSLAPQVVDPTPQIEAQIQAICIYHDCPKRIFMGSERGELASSQDDGSWNDNLAYRQNYYLTPCIISPVVDRLIAMRVLPVPSDGYEVTWPDLGSISAEVKANIAVKRTEAMAKYIQGSVEGLMGELDFLTRVLEIPIDEAEEILKDATPLEDLRLEEEPNKEAPSGE